MNEVVNDWYGPDAATFGDRLAAARDGAGLTQEQLARQLGVRLKTLRGWEDDMSEPRANRISMLAGLLNVSVMWLLNGEGEGLEGPVTGDAVTQEAADMLRDLRTLQSGLRVKVEELGRLEKRMRKALADLEA